jgi:hypothetical protein
MSAALALTGAAAGAARYTVGEDAAIWAAALAGTPWRRLAAELGRSRSGLMGRYEALAPPAPAPAVVPPPSGPKPRYNAWTPAQDAYLAAWWGVKPDREVLRGLAARGPARRLPGCERHAWQMGFGRRDNALMLPEAARIFGVLLGTVTTWVRGGLLLAQRRPFRRGTGLVWHVPDESLRRFVRQHGHPYDLDRMAPGHWLTAYAAGVLAGPWLTLPAAAREVHFAWGSVWRWVRAGDLAARSHARRQKMNPLMVHREALLAAAAAHDARARERQRAARLRYLAASTGGAA